MSGAFTIAELEADVAFLVLRSMRAGSFGGEAKRWTGLSSNALVALAYGGKQDEWPSDRDDYAACVRTFVRLPRHRRTPEVRAGLARARGAYLENYPEDATAASRREARARREREYLKWRKGAKRRRTPA